MYVSITDTIETFVDDRNGNLIGSAGGTGTINYATAAFYVTFAVAPAGAQAITANYYTEDATDDGILDFDASAGGAGLGKVFRQDDGGELMGIGSFLGVDYWLHRQRPGRSPSHSTTPTARTSHTAPSASRIRAPSVRRRRYPAHRHLEPERAEGPPPGDRPEHQQPHHRTDADLRCARPQRPRIRERGRLPLGRL